MLLQNLESRGLIRPPDWLSCNTMYLTIMGSEAYGCASDISDKDIYGFCIPPKDEVFPHLAGHIHNFGRQRTEFYQWQQHHVFDKDALGGKGLNYDLSIYNIVRYFTLLMENNPNIIDSIFTPVECVIHSTKISNMVRDNREMFLHKGCWHKFKGYAFSQLHKMQSKNPEGKRVALREEFGFDVKFGMHVVRLMVEVEQILAEGTIDLRRNSEQLKAIRRGEVSEQQIRELFTIKEKELEKLYHESKLPYGPPEGNIKNLLLQCLEEHYGSLDKCIVNENEAMVMLREIKEIIDRKSNLFYGK